MSGLYCFCLVLILPVDGLILLSPKIEPTQQSCCVFDSFFLELDHRTGGRLFVRSRTVGHDELVTRQLLGATRDDVQRD